MGPIVWYFLGHKYELFQNLFLKFFILYLPGRPHLGELVMQDGHKSLYCNFIQVSNKRQMDLSGLNVPKWHLSWEWHSSMQSCILWAITDPKKIELVHSLDSSHMGAKIKD